MKKLFAAAACCLGLSACNPDTFQQQLNDSIGYHKTYTQDGPPITPFKY